MWSPSGDKRPDYLCMEKDGRTTAFLNKGLNNWVDVGQVKFSEGWDRANIHYADANGNLNPMTLPPLPTYRKDNLYILLTNMLTAQAMDGQTCTGLTSSTVT